VGGGSRKIPGRRRALMDPEAARAALLEDLQNPKKVERLCRRAAACTRGIRGLRRRLSLEEEPK
jgi:hypothetical protein